MQGDRMYIEKPKPAFISYGEADKSKKPDRRTNTQSPTDDAVNRMRNWSIENKK